MSATIDLSDLQELWSKATPTAAGFSPIEDGDYVGDIKEMKVEESKASKRRQIVTTFEIVANEDYEGKTVKRFDGMTQQGMGFFMGMAEIIGLDMPEDINQLQAVLDVFVANNQDYYDIHVKTTQDKDKGKTYTNVYVNKISESYTKGEGTQPAEEEQTQEPEPEPQEVVAPLAAFKKKAAPVTNGAKAPAPVAMRTAAAPTAAPKTKVLARR